MSVFDQIRFVHRALRFRLRDDRAEIRFARAHVTPGTCAIDIGAHKGAYTYWLRRWVGPDGRVVAFEPQPALADYLARIVHRAGWKNVTIEHAALWHQAATMTLAVPGDRGTTSPGARLVSGAAVEGDQTFTVRALALDEYLADRKRPVSFIKCDVEGAELHVFRGAEGILRSDRPVLLFECEQRHHGNGPIDRVFEYLASLGYRGQFFDCGQRHPIAEFEVQRHQRRKGERFFDQPGYCNNFAFAVGHRNVV